MEISKNKIRNIFYFATITIVLILSSVLSGSYLNLFHEQTETKINQLANGVVDMKKIYVKDVVKRTLQDIEIERRSILSSEISKLDQWQYTFEESNTSDFEKILELWRQSSLDLVFQNIEVIVYNRITKGIDFDSNQDNNKARLESVNDEAKLLALYSSSSLTRIIDKDEYLIILNIEPQKIDNLVKAKITKQVREEILVDNGYIWINKIINYDGGDDYAVRVVHPNLPDTEGTFLSTNTLDLDGNQPYLIELEGIKKDGQLYYEYYFKKKDSHVIAHKLSYAELYKPFDWVVATGVYLDDVDALILKETSDMENTQRSLIYKTLAIVGFCIALSLALIYYFEKLISGLIHHFEAEVNQKNKELQIEKNKIERIANLDSLTGLLTRRAMQVQLDGAHHLAMTHKRDYVVAIGDIDHFKRINDLYGHQAGDFILREISDVFKETLEDHVSVARWGGEEFLFLFNKTDVKKATEAMEKLRVLIENKVFSYDSQPIKVSISIGLTGFKPDDATFDAVLKESDRKLYLAKTTGRNKVIG